MKLVYMCECCGAKFATELDCLKHENGHYTNVEWCTPQFTEVDGAVPSYVIVKFNNKLGKTVKVKYEYDVEWGVETDEDD